MKEATELSTTPSPDLHAAPTDDTNLYDWHFTITGPPSPSPYSSGIYHGRITFPPSYPLRPPSFRFLTPSGRFEVNREICLSISGHHEESWQPAWGVRTALVAIRSFMDGDAKGQVGGLDVDEGVRRGLARESREWVCSVCQKRNLDILPPVQNGQDGQTAQDAQDVQGVQGVQDTAKTGAGQNTALGEVHGQTQPVADAQSQPAMERQTHEQTQPEAERGPDTMPQGQAQPEGESVAQAQAQPAMETQTQAQGLAPRAGTQVLERQDRVQGDRDYLDTAIVVVVIALAIMIARRILNAQLDDYL